MSFPDPDWLQFGQIANELANEPGSRRPWSELLHSLIAAFWQGKFEANGASVLRWENYIVDGSASGPKEQADRQFLVRLMPTLEWWVPESVRRADNRYPELFPWHDLASMKPEKYESNWRVRFIERLAIQHSDYRPWAWQEQMPTPISWQSKGGVEPSDRFARRRGRPGAKNLLMAEYRRRVAAGETNDSTTKEAEILRKWHKREHPEKQPGPKASTIRRQIHEYLRETKERNS